MKSFDVLMEVRMSRGRGNTSSRVQTGEIERDRAQRFFRPRFRLVTQQDRK